MYKSTIAKDFSRILQFQNPDAFEAYATNRAIKYLAKRLTSKANPSKLYTYRELRYPTFPSSKLEAQAALDCAVDTLISRQILPPECFHCKMHSLFSVVPSASLEIAFLYGQISSSFLLTARGRVVITPLGDDQAIVTMKPVFRMLDTTPYTLANIGLDRPITRAIGIYLTKKMIKKRLKSLKPTHHHGMTT